MKKIFMFVVATLSLLFAQSAFAVTTDYVNYWTMDEGTGRSVNDSVGGQNGVMVGTSTGFGWASGKVGTAIGMDGTTGTGIVLPNSALKGSQGSISVWLNAQSLSDRNIILSAKSTTDNNIYAAFVIDKDGRPMFQSRDTTNGNDRKAQGVKLLNKNEWYNLVFTADAQAYHMFVNGEEITVAGDNIGRWFSDITNQTLAFRIGMLDSQTLYGSFDGYLDDLRIYSRALTPSEVVDLYTTTNAARPTIPAGVAPKVTLTISDDHIPFGGSVNLGWSTVNADSCTASGGWNGVMATSGSMVFVKLATDTSYTLSCGNAKYGSDASTAKVTVGTTTSVTSSGTLTVTAIPTLSTSSPATDKGRGLALGRNLTQGSRGDDVHSLQLYFISLGLLPETAATGYFGNLTKAALVKYQKSHGLPSTGYLGAMTRKVLSENN